MIAHLSYHSILKKNSIVLNIAGSKSESNRLLILQQLFNNLKVQNLSNCNDTLVIQHALNSEKINIDIHHAGTAMRFLTAYFSTKKGNEITLTGSQRMKERPIKVLVEALQQLGADIQYLENEGYPPLLISGKKLDKSSVIINANVSSQYISALMLIAPSLPHGLKIELEGEIASRPYLEMTLSLLKKMGVPYSFNKNEIIIQPLQKIEESTIEIESDWSSASYFYSLVALSNHKTMTLRNFKKDSLQGDSILPKIYKQFGVHTSFNTLNNEIIISKSENIQVKFIALDLTEAPDIAQTIAVTCFGLKIPCKLKGLQTLKIKETDRLKALKNELEKLGAQVLITQDSLELLPATSINSGVLINTYEDHRMAMAFAPLALKTDILINKPKVVEKSYPNFWQDLENTGVLINYK